MQYKIPRENNVHGIYDYYISPKISSTTSIAELNKFLDILLEDTRYNI